MRAAAGTIASIIIIGFLVAVVIPLLVHLVEAGARSAYELQLAAAKPRPVFNITVAGLEPRTYTVENQGAPTRIKYLFVEDGTGSIYVVEARDAWETTIYAGSAGVEVVPVELAEAVPGAVSLATGGVINISVSGGRLIGILTDNGYAAVNVVQQETSTQSVQYAAVAGSIKTNYVDLNGFQSLEDLFSSSDIIFTTNPSSNTSDPSLLNQGAFQSICFTGVDPNDPGSGVSGGFQPVVDQEQVYAIYIHNLGVWPGSMVLGGRSSDYSQPAISFSLYMAGYDLVAYNASSPGFIVLHGVNPNTGLDEVAFCYSYVFSDGSALSDCFPQGYFTWGQTSLAGSELYDFMAANRPLYYLPWGARGSLDGAGMSFAYSDKLGLVAWNSYLALYCPPGGVSVSASTGTYVFNVTGTCWIAYKGYDAVYEGYLTGGYMEASSVQELYGDNDVGLRGTLVTHFTYYLRYALYAGDLGADKEYPRVLKVVDVTGDKNVLSVYDSISGGVRSGTAAFGVYLYGGRYFETESGVFKVYYYVKDFYGEDGYLSLFAFQRGATSGLRPYVVLADTDGNGLTELVIIDEWFGPDYYSSGETDLSDLVGALGATYHPVLGVTNDYYGYGCVAKTLGYFYIKFGGQYAVNGSQVAEVSVQIRFSFHDDVAGDIDEVDNSTTGLWGFALVDSNGTEVSSSMYNYQQLAPLEDTWPISMPFQSESVYLPVPDKPQLYYVVFKFGDPYSWVYSGYENVHDDVDMTIRVEWLGMWYLHR